VDSADEPDQPLAHANQRTLPAGNRAPRRSARHVPRQRGAADPAGPSTAGIDTPDVAILRQLAAEGRLASTFACATPDERRCLYSAAYSFAYPIVYDVVTRKVELGRGHGSCARSVRHLGDVCVDGFYNDVEATIDYLFAHARQPIGNLEAWVAGRATKAAVDGHRKRRGDRGALQRPRMTAALANGLGHDQWLMDLALSILTWVGVTSTAGADVWPLESWVQRRAMIKGSPEGCTPIVVQREIDQVLDVMRRQPSWYADYVERPLGRKIAPTASPPGDGHAYNQPLRLVNEYELEDIRVADLACAAIEAIRAGLRRGDDPCATVARVLAAVFAAGSGAEEIGRVPGTGSAFEARVSALILDPVGMAGIVDEVLAIIGGNVQQ
jgi:hypothetical protein